MSGLHPYDVREDFDWRLIDAELGLPSDDEITTLAASIHRAKLGGKHPQMQVLTPDYLITGLFGERHFARVFRLPMNLKVQAYRRGAVNFRLNDGTTVDVMTRRIDKDYFRPRSIFIPVDKHPTADVCCMVHYNVPSALYAYEEEIVGWEITAEIIEHGEVKKGWKPGQADNIIWPGYLLRDVSGLMIRHRPDDPRAQIARPQAAPAPPEAVIDDAPLVPTSVPMFGADYALGKPKRTRRQSIDESGGTGQNRKRKR